MSYVSKYFSKSEYECRCRECGQVPDDATLVIADALRKEWGSPLKCTSGARCHNYTMYLRMHGIPAALGSAHIDGLAMDLVPANGKIAEFQEFVKNQLVRFQIRMEDPLDSPGWVHFDLRPVPRGKSRVFRA